MGNVPEKCMVVSVKFPQKIEPFIGIQNTALRVSAISTELATRATQQVAQ